MQSQRTGSSSPRTRTARMLMRRISASGWHCTNNGNGPETLKELAPSSDKKLEGPFFTQIEFVTGDCCFSKEDWDGAIAHFDRFVSGQPNEAKCGYGTAKARLWPMITRATTTRQGTRSRNSSASKTRAPIYRWRWWSLAGCATSRDNTARRGRRWSRSFRSLAIARCDRKLSTIWVGFRWRRRRMPRPSNTLRLSPTNIRNTRWRRTPACSKRWFWCKRGILKARAPHWKVSRPTIRPTRNWTWQSSISACRSRVNSNGRVRGNNSRRWSKSFPKSTLRDRATYEWAWCEKGLKRPPEALKQYAALLAAFPHSELVGAVTFELAELEFEAKHYDDASKRLSSLVEQYEGQDAARARAVPAGLVSRSRRSNGCRLAKAFEAMLTEFPKSELAVVASYQAGEARLKLKEFEPAYQHFLRAASGDGGNEVKRAGVATARRMSGADETLGGIGEHVREFLWSTIRRANFSAARSSASVGRARTRRNSPRREEAYRTVLTTAIATRRARAASSRSASVCSR